jgi:hypothetical protein
MSWLPLVPGVDDLTDAPELAALHLLDTALLVASNALVAQNLELQTDDFVREVAAHRAVEACLADATLTHIEALQAAIAKYRACLRERQRALTCTSSVF